MMPILENFSGLIKKYFPAFLFLAMLGVVLLLDGSVTLTHGFVFDDDYLIVNNPYIGSWKNIIFFFTRDVTQATGLHVASGYYRPLSMVVLQCLFCLFKTTAWKYHLFNLVLHALNAALTGTLLWRLFASHRAAIMAALLFAIHPIHIEAAVLVCAYMGLLSTASVLLAFILYYESRVREKSWLMFLSLIVYAAGLLCKEDALLFPFAVMLGDALIFKKNRKELLSESLLDLLPFWAFAGFYLISRGLFVEKGAAFGFWSNVSTLNIMQPGGWEGWVASVFLTVKSYLFLWVWPATLTIHHVLTLPADLLGWVGFGAECVLVLIVLLMILRFEPGPFFLGWFFIFVFIVSNVIPIGGMFAERLIYLPSVGLACLVALLFESALRSGGAILKKILLVAGVVALGAFWSFQTVSYGRVWQSDYELWSHALRLAPDQPYPALQLARAFEKEKDFLSAGELNSQTANRMGKAASTSMIRRRAAQDFGTAKHFDRAIQEYKTLLIIEPLLWDVRFDLGWTYLLKGDKAAATKVFNATLKRNPDHGWSYYGLAEIAFKEGHVDEMGALYAKALNHSQDKQLLQVILKNLKIRSKN